MKASLLACKLAVLTLALAASCATSTPPPPNLPPLTDVEMLAGMRPALPEIPPGLAKGRDRSIAEGQCKGLPAGMWVSEFTFAERIVAVAERNRLRVEVEAYRKLRNMERDAALELQDAYRQQLDKSQRRGEVRLWTGIALGVAIVLATGYAITQVTR